MSEAQQQSLGKRCNFFCGLHALVHLAEVASSAAVEAENGFLGEQLPIMDGSFLKTKEPGATRPIRTACKVAAQGGDGKSGCHGTFLEYTRPKLRDDGFHSLPSEPFRGSRFNILFQNAASVFFLRNADCERSFSVVRKIHKDCRQSLNSDTLTALSQCKMNDGSASSRYERFTNKRDMPRFAYLIFCYDGL